MSCVCTTLIHANTADTDTADAVLKQIMSETRSGDPHAMWRAYERFFSHPNRNDVDGSHFLSCFRMSGCFHLDTLVNVLGKSKDDVRKLIEGFCPHFNTWQRQVRLSERYKDLPDEAFEKVFRDAKSGLHRFNGYDKSREDWAHRIESSALEQRIVRQIEPVIWPLLSVRMHDVAIQSNDSEDPLARPEEDDEVWWPVISYTHGNTKGDAIVDTGTSNIVFQLDDEFPQDEFVHTHDAVINVGAASKLMRTNEGLLREIRIGETSFHNMLVVLLPPEIFGSEQAIGNLDVFGMSMLMLYDSVCFAWEQKRLYLGDLGPCVDGVEVPAEYSGRGELYVRISTQHEDRQWNAFIDTGAESSYCSPELFDRIDEHVFYINRNHELNGTCYQEEGLQTNDDDLFDPSAQNAIIGLHTLQAFEAWGWRRGPMATYFVLKENEINSD